MPSFVELLQSTDADLVKTFHRLSPGDETDFIKRINHAATHVGMNHTELVCALGFNKHIRDLTDILSVVGFSSYKLLSYRRNELFTTDAYRQLPINDIVSIYSDRIEDAEILATLRELVPQRLVQIEKVLAEVDDSPLLVSYMMEIHSIYAGGIATAEIAAERTERPIGFLRSLTKEVGMIAEQSLVPPGNMFFSDELLPNEKRLLIESGYIDPAMIANRLKNSEISEDERQVLEDFT